MRDAAKIRCGVAQTQPEGCTANDPQAQQFPIADPRPSIAERDTVVAWLEGGLP